MKEIFREYRLEMIPNVFSAGYGGAILAHDKNLAEGLPVKDTLYVVKSGQAHIEPDVPVADGGPAVEGAWMREVAVRRYRCYRVTFRAKTEGLPATRSFSSGAFRLDVRTEDKRNLTPWNARVPGTTEWREVRWGFNSLWYDKVKISIGAPNARTVKAWVDSARVEEVGLLNVLRRPETPTTVRSDSGKTVYDEVRHAFFSQTRRIYRHGVPNDNRAFPSLAGLPTPHWPCIRFLYVESEISSSAFFRSRLATDTLA